MVSVNTDLYQSALAIPITALLCFVQIWQGYIALAIGAVFMGGTLLRYRQLPEIWHPLLQLQWQLSPYYFALILAIIVYGVSGSKSIGLAMVALALSGYFALLIQRTTNKGAQGQNQVSHSLLFTITTEIKAAIRESYHLAYGLTLGLALFPILLHFEIPFGLNRNNTLFALMEFLSLILLAKLILQRGVAIRLHRRTLPLKWGWHGLLVLSYF